MEPSTALGLLVGLAFFGWLGFKIYNARKDRPSGDAGGGGRGGGGRDTKLK